MAEGTRLLNEQTSKGVSRVRIPPSPPAYAHNYLLKKAFQGIIDIAPYSAPFRDVAPFIQMHSDVTHEASKLGPRRTGKD